MTKPNKYLYIGFQYLTVVATIADEIAKHGNRGFVIKGAEITDSELEREMFWTDSSFCIPLLFNLYHGIEVILKGFIEFTEETKKKHNITELYRNYIEIFGENELGTVLSRYIEKTKMPSLISDYLDSIGIEIDDYFEAWRYPNNKDDKEYSHSLLMHKGANGSKFYSDLVADIRNIKMLIIRDNEGIIKNEEI